MLGRQSAGKTSEGVDDVTIPATSSGLDGSRGAPEEVAARAAGLTKVYGEGQTAVTALRAIDAEFRRGHFTAIMGPSGSGKSTLMHCLAGLDTVTSGHVFIGDVELSTLKDKELTMLRRDRVGFIFQQFNLLTTLTARENITLPLDIAGRKPDQEWLDTVVDAVALRDRLEHRPTRAVRRPAAARRVRPRDGRQARDHLRRRADR